MTLDHAAILIDNQTQTKKLVDAILKGNLIGFDTVLGKNIGIFSQHQIESFIEEEERHDLKILTKSNAQSLKSMSSGERKKALLDHLLKQNHNCLVLVNPYDNLDVQTQTQLREKFERLGVNIQLVQIVSRAIDIFASTQIFYGYSNQKLTKYPDISTFQKQGLNVKTCFEKKIPIAPDPIDLSFDILVNFKNVSVDFDGRTVLHEINWTVKKGEFWELVGPNGSGKTTLLNMITGDSPKSYGQDITLFGHKKGSGESVWDIKELIGYFTPAMTDRFRGYHTLENMLISGLHDSIGLYQKPSDTEKHIAQDWLTTLRLESKKNEYFHQLSLGEKRLLMAARAMVKHPPLLILDEPTTGLDDTSAHFFIALVNTFAQESDSAIVFVSHRKELGLDAKQRFELRPTQKGSMGKTHETDSNIHQYSKTK